MTASPISVSWAIDVSLLLADRSWRKMAILGILQVFTFAVMIFFGWITGGLTVAMTIWANLASNSVTAVAGCLMTHEWRLGWSGIWALFREGTSLVGAQIADIASRRLDQALALSLIGASGAGIYAVAVSMGTLTLPVAQAISAGALASLVAGGHSVYGRVIRQSAGVSAVISLALAPILWAAIPMLFGVEFVGAVPVAFVILAGSHFANVGYVCVTACMAAELGGRMTAVQIAGMLISFGVALSLGPSWGASGVAAGMGVGSLLTFIVYLRVLRLPISSAFPMPNDVVGGVRLLLSGGGPA